MGKPIPIVGLVSGEGLTPKLDEDEAVVEKIFVDTDGHEYERIGGCAGPKITYRGPEGDVTKYVAPHKAWSVPDAAFETLLETPEAGGARRRYPEERPVLSTEFFLKFVKLDAEGEPQRTRAGVLRRVGCDVQVFLAITPDTYDGMDKRLACHNCGGHANFHGEGPPGSALAALKAEALAERLKARAKG